MRFKISRKLEQLFEIRAANYEQAAHAAARKLYGRKATAMRTTGTAGMSGYYQAYVPMPKGQGGSNSVGEPFHVMDLS